MFERYDVVVTPSAVVRGDGPPPPRDGGRGTRADEALAGATSAGVAPRVLELSEFLVDELGVTDIGAVFPHRVAFHPTCHSMRLLEIGDRPRRLLAAVDGLELVDIPGADQCCGFGGTFAVKNAETSLAMGGDKLAAVEASGADVLTAADTSCLLHFGGMLSRAQVADPGDAPRRDPREAGAAGMTAPRQVPGRRRPRSRGTPPFPEAARDALADDQLRRNLKRATTTIRRSARGR